MVFPGELGMACGIVHAYPYHFRAHRGELVQVVAESAGLLGASRRIVLGIKIQHQPFAAEITQAAHASVLVRQAEIRRILASFRRTGSACHTAPHHHRRRQYQQQNKQFHGTDSFCTLRCGHTQPRNSSTHNAAKPLPKKNAIAAL